VEAYHQGEGNFYRVKTSDMRQSPNMKPSLSKYVDAAHYTDNRKCYFLMGLRNDIVVTPSWNLRAV
jgi:hypothetical protein